MPPEGSAEEHAPPTAAGLFMMLANGLFMTGVLVKAAAPGPAAPAPGLFMMLADGLFMTAVVVKATAPGPAAPAPG